MNREVKGKGNDFELVYSTREKLSKEEIKKLKEAKKKAVSNGKIIRK